MSNGTDGTVRMVLRVEGICVLAAALLAYSKFHFSWAAFAIFFFSPDISFLGYLAGPRLGSIAYNTAHSYIGAIACLVAGFLFSSPTFTRIGVIWCGHIGFDRAFGYGLKYAIGIGFTHLGLVGRKAKFDSTTSLNPAQG